MPRIYTRTGDAGETALFDGTRVSKADPRVDAYGHLDELGSWLGLVRSALFDEDLAEMVEAIQRDLLAFGAVLADPQRRIASRVQKVIVRDDAVVRLEGWIDSLESNLPPLRRFILPGGGQAGAMLHVARAVCRRVERRIVALGAEAGDSGVIIYLNRLSDLLFTMARAANARAQRSEPEW